MGFNGCWSSNIILNSVSLNKGWFLGFESQSVESEEKSYGDIDDGEKERVKSNENLAIVVIFVKEIISFFIFLWWEFFITSDRLE